MKKKTNENRLMKREIRQRTSQLRSLVCEWDPIGVTIAPGWPRDEYDCLLGPLLTLLASGAGKEAIEEFLEKELVEHFGMSPVPGEIPAVAQRIHAWFDLGWRDFHEPVTVYVPLLQEGVDVWRPVQDRPLASGLYRIIGVNADVGDERWEFPPGTIVRCEPMTYADGTTGLAAVEKVWPG